MAKETNKLLLALCMKDETREDARRLAIVDTDADAVAVAQRLVDDADRRRFDFAVAARFYPGE